MDLMLIRVYTGGNKKMNVVNPDVKIIDKLDYDNILRKIELCARVCYKSEDKITFDSAENFIRNLIKKGHESVIEHFSFSVRFIVDRGISHEIVRHRIASYSQESTRYCNYHQDKFNNEITVINPMPDEESKSSAEHLSFLRWKKSCENSEREYFELLKKVSPQIARSVLPTSLKTEVIMTANLRSWRNFLKQRTSKNAHPQIKYVADKLLKNLKNTLPVFFEDIEGD